MKQKLLERLEKAKSRLKKNYVSKTKYFGTYGLMNYKEFISLDNKWSGKVLEEEFILKLEKYCDGL